MGKNGETDYEVQISSYKNNQRDVKYSIMNIVNNIIITMYYIRWVPDLSE